MSNKIKDLKEEIIHGLEVLGENDRDIRTLTTWCNPNFIRGADKTVKPEILKILDELEKQGKINKKKKKIQIYQYRGPTEFILYQLK